jgi:hypothetical protein
MLETLPHMTRGQAAIKQDGKVRTFASPGRLFNRLNVDSFALDYLIKNYTVETRMARRYQEAVEAYDEDQVQDLLAKLPNAVHTGQGLRVGDTSYVSLNELIAIIRRKHTFADPTYRESKISHMNSSKMTASYTLPSDSVPALTVASYYILARQW